MAPRADSPKTEDASIPGQDADLRQLELEPNTEAPAPASVGQARSGELTTLAWSIAQVLVDLLDRNGWTCVMTSGFAGGVLWTAIHRRSGAEVRVEGSSGPEAVPRLVRECAKYVGEHGLMAA